MTAIDDRRPAVLDVIRSARERIVLSLFRCNDAPILDELARATARGVAVDALVTARAKGGRRRLEKLGAALAAAGATVHVYSDPVVKYHAKYLVADDGPAVVASLNFTRKCLTSTIDALVITGDPGVVTGLQALFAADRDGRPLPDPLSQRLIVGPERARAQFTALIDGARTRIRLADAKLSDPAISARLAVRRAAGVRVDIYSSKRVGALKLHGKFLLVDDRAAVVGALALGALSLDFRREVAVLVEQPDAVSQISRLFDEIAAAAPASDAVTPVPAGDARG